MSEHLDAVVALSGEFSPDLTEIGQGTQQRMGAAISVAQAENVPLVVSGNYSFRWRKPPPQPLAHLMKDYAMECGMPNSMVIVQDESLDTVGDALFTKIRVTEPRDWKRLIIVTSEQHLPRSQRVFRHVMGPDYSIEGLSSGTAEGLRFQRLQESVGNIFVQAVLSDSNPGDTMAIQERLFRTVRGYSETSRLGRTLNMVSGLWAA